MSHLYTSSCRRAERSPWDIYTRTSRTCSHSGRRTAGGSGHTRWCLEQKVTSHSHTTDVQRLHGARESARVASRTFAGHHRPGLKAVITRTLEPTDHIGAGAVAAGIPNFTLVNVCVDDSYVNLINHRSVGLIFTRWMNKWGRVRETKRGGRGGRRGRGDTDCELTYTSDSTGVQAVSHGTFTAERAVCVDALAVDTRVVDAFIDIYNEKTLITSGLHSRAVTEKQDSEGSVMTLFTFWGVVFPLLVSHIGTEKKIPFWNREMRRVINTMK